MKPGFQTGLFPEHVANVTFGTAWVEIGMTCPGVGQLPKQWEETI